MSEDKVTIIETEPKKREVQTTRTETEVTTEPRPVETTKRTTTTTEVRKD
jgi:hypothetical protein